MQNQFTRFPFRKLCVLIGLVLCVDAFVAASDPAQVNSRQQNSSIQVGESYHNDISPALRDLAMLSSAATTSVPLPLHANAPCPVVAQGLLGLLVPEVMPPPILSFDGITCGCAPPSANGEAGATQYVQVVSGAYQVFDKATGASILGPNSISSLFSGFGGVCQNNSAGDSILLYDQIAGRWLISQLAGIGVQTDACIAISTTGDATGTWFRYGFHLGNNFFTNSMLSVWPDGYYMSLSVFNSGGTAYLGPQPFALERTKMIAGMPASSITTGITVGPDEAVYLPADLDGSTLPPAGAPNSFLEFPAHGTYRLFHFHADFTTPANSTFTLFASPPAAAFTPLCPGMRNCVPQAGTTNSLDGAGNRLMFRLAYRNLGTPTSPNESLVANFSVESGGVAGVHWFELKNVTAGPVQVAQENTYQPDTDWRWLGSAAMDRLGDLAIGFSASSSSINPQIRYAGRLATDPPNTLAQGEAHLFDSMASQTNGSAWGDFSDLTIDPVDDCTFWYTNEYPGAPVSGPHTRIGSFKFAQCHGSVTPTPTPSCVPLVEDFNDITILPGAGWVQTNHSAVVGTTNWFQGNSTVFPAHQGAGTSYIGANFNNTTGTNTISNWLLTPPISLLSGITMNFWTRTVDAPQFPDRLQVRMSTNGASANVGTTATDVGDFTTLLLDINPTYTTSGYPNVWTRFEVTVTGVPSLTTGRLAFRYFVEDGGPTGSNSDYIGIDTVAAGYCEQSPTPTPTATATATFTPTATATATGTPSPSSPTPTATTAPPTPTPTPAAQALNLSTRMRVLTDANVGIGGFIITGTAPKFVLLRGIGPSLSNFGVPDPLADPILELHGPTGFVTIINNNWREQQPTNCDLKGNGLAPTNDLESAICATLDPGAYTAILRGNNNGTGVGLVEVYDLQAAASKLANISTRAFVGTGTDIVIGGFILGGNSSDSSVVLRGLGPSLSNFGVPDPLADPTLELRDSNGMLLASSDNWQDNFPPGKLAPPNPLESAIGIALSPGQYTALLAGKNNGTGVGLVEVYDLGQ